MDLIEKGKYIKNIEDYGFPWKRKFYDDHTIKRWMKNLEETATLPRFVVRDYNFRNISGKFSFHKKKYVFIWEEEDYENFNMLSDMFQEEERMKCKRKFERFSPYDFFFKNVPLILSKIKGTKIREFDVREALYNLTSECSSHRPLNMAFMIDLFVSSRGKILDCCAGWGDRLIGAISRRGKISEYVGVDPNPRLFKGYEEMIKFFVSPTQRKKFRMINSRFEDYTPSKGYFDLVYTSPPYFDFENYRIEIIQKTSEDWFNGFMLVLMEKSTVALKKGGILAININQEKGEDYVEKLIKRKYSCLVFLGVFPYANSLLKNPQPIWIWQKK
jgi:16S rRNA G966 N2-methylase RsmD